MSAFTRTDSPACEVTDSRREPSNANPSNAEVPGTPEGRRRTRRILVADDNIDAGESLAMLLRLDGHEVQLATNGPEALDVFTRMRPEIAILDIGMPGLNGYEVALRIRAQTRDRSVMLIAVTGWGQQSDKARAMSSGFDFHFTKPVEPTALSSLLLK